MADRIVIMKDGHIQQVGTPAEVYHKPANTFVAQFIGAPSMNMLPGAVNGGGTVELARGARCRFGRSLRRRAPDHPRASDPKIFSPRAASP